MSNKPELKIEMVETAALIPYARNTKKHSQEQIDTVARSITAFGFNAPVLIDDKNTIIAGHCRVLAAMQIKLKEVPCIRLSHLDENQRKAYVIADNRLSEIGSAGDYDMLRAELGSINFDGIVELREDDFGFGFHAQEGAGEREPTGDGTHGQNDGQDGESNGGRFILTYQNDEEREEWLRRIGGSSEKSVYTVEDIGGAESGT